MLSCVSTGYVVHGRERFVNSPISDCRATPITHTHTAIPTSHAEHVRHPTASHDGTGAAVPHGRHEHVAAASICLEQL